MTGPAKPSAWSRWKEVAARAATFQARVLLGMFYWTMLAPFAWMTGDPLEIHGDHGGRWHRTPDSDPSSQL